MLGHRSEREVLRNRLRTTAAMAAQICERGRNLGGRQPYGYRLVDAGPHPMAMDAGWGRRQHRLDPDPVAAPTVKWMFACRLDGMSAAGIARLLNERSVPSPDVYDHERNKHRTNRLARCLMAHLHPDMEQSELHRMFQLLASALQNHVWTEHHLDAAIRVAELRQAHYHLTEERAQELLRKYRNHRPDFAARIGILVEEPIEPQFRLGPTLYQYRSGPID